MKLRDRLRRRSPLSLIVLAAALALATLFAACSAQAGTSTAPTSGGDACESPGTSGDAAADAGAKAASGGDWKRVLQIVANLHSVSPDKPVVVLLGGSSARESTVSDSDWRRQIKAKGGPATEAFNLGSRNRTMAQNVALVQALPPVPTIVYIGVNVGSFTSAQKTARISLPTPGSSSVSLQQPHQYSQKRLLSTTKKRSLVKAWRTKRYPVFQRNFDTSAGVLERLIKVCKARHFRPVLFELPRNMSVIGRQFDKPIKRYRAKCATLADRHDIPFVSFVAAARLRNGDFYDLWHLVEPGRKKWQGLLSAKTAKLLQQYGYDAGG